MLISCAHIFDFARADRDWAKLVSIVSLVWASIFVFSGYLQQGTIYRFSNFYVAMLMLFHLGVTYSGAFSIYDNVRWSADPWLIRANWYVILSLGCFGIGHVPALHPVASTVAKEHTECVLHVAYWYGLGLLMASVIFLIIAIASLGNLLAYSRVDFFRGAGDTRGLGVFLMVFPSALLLLAIGSTTRVQQLFATVIGVLGFLLLLLSGYRTSALFPAIQGGIIWVKTGRRIPRTLALTTIFLFALAVSMIGTLRQAGSYDSLDSEDLKRSVESSSLRDTFLLGQTGGLLGHVLRLVPIHDPFRYGETYFNAFLDSLPNITGTMQESARAAAIREAMSDPTALARMPPSDWLTYHIAHWAFGKGQGVGFTTIGEAYLNFGTVGVVLFFLLLGFLLGKLDTVCLLRNPRLLLFCSTMLWHLMRTVRDDFANFIKPAVFTFIVLALWRAIGYFLFPARVKVRAP